MELSFSVFVFLNIFSFLGFFFGFIKEVSPPGLFVHSSGDNLAANGIGAQDLATRSHRILLSNLKRNSSKVEEPD